MFFTLFCIVGFSNASGTSSSSAKRNVATNPHGYGLQPDFLLNDCNALSEDELLHRDLCFASYHPEYYEEIQGYKRWKSTPTWSIWVKPEEGLEETTLKVALAVRGTKPEPGNGLFGDNFQNLCYQVFNVCPREKSIREEIQKLFELPHLTEIELMNNETIKTSNFVKIEITTTGYSLGGRLVIKTTDILRELDDAKKYPNITWKASYVFNPFISWGQYLSESTIRNLFSRSYSDTNGYYRLQAILIKGDQCSNNCLRFDLDGNVKQITGLTNLNTVSGAKEGGIESFWSVKSLLGWFANPVAGSEATPRNKMSVNLQRHLLGAFYMKSDDKEALTNTEVDVILQLKNMGHNDAVSRSILVKIKDMIPRPTSVCENVEDFLQQIALNWNRFIIGKNIAKEYETLQKTLPNRESGTRSPKTLSRHASA